MRESLLLNDLIRGLWPVVHLWRANAGEFYGKSGHKVRGMPKGFPDLFGIVPAYRTKSGHPMPVFLEAKVHPNTPTKEQIAFIKGARRAGCIAAVVYSVEDALEIVCSCVSDDALVRRPQEKGGDHGTA